jgi:hypothetical protein
MGEIRLYLDNETEEKMEEAAKAAGVSPSRWIADLIREKTTKEWPAWVAELVGSWTENDFPSLEEIRAGLPPDLPRESL